VSAAAREVANQPKSTHIGSELGAEITRLCSQIYAAEARLLQLIREFDEQQYWAELGLCSCAHWLNLKCGIGMNAAREKVRVAHALGGLSKIAAAFACGAVSYSKVRAMTRIATPENEDYLLMIAEHGTAHHVEKLVSRFRAAGRCEDDSPAESQRRERELSYYYDEDGSLVIQARLPAEQGALVLKALERAMDRQYADAEENSTDVTAETSDPVKVRRADALADIAETYFADRDTAGSTADRYQVVVHVTAETSYIDDGPHVTAEASRRIACDSSIVALREDAAGQPLSIGRRSRTIPPSMRRALQARDGGCRFPGCTNARFVDGHHIEHWADGGETSLDNLVLLCRHHHHLVHEGGYACRRNARGDLIFEDSRSTLLATGPALPGIGAGRDIRALMDRWVFEEGIDVESCAARWYAGERLDWQMAVSALCQWTGR
jgi:hypothetical protein